MGYVKRWTWLDDLRFLQALHLGNKMIIGQSIRKV
jgi:hypothetical protein